jgi:hypothetical protein
VEIKPVTGHGGFAGVVDVEGGDVPMKSEPSELMNGEYLAI